MIVILTGAQKNIGDYLIGFRAKELLYRYVDKEIIEISRFQKLDSYVDQINSSRAVLLCGGPAYYDNIYPGIYPLVDNLDDIRVPIIPFGLGWSGNPSHAPESFKFNSKSNEFLRRIHEKIAFSSCRDNITEEILRKEGFGNVLMTGCPVWYDLDSIGTDFYRPQNIRRIVFTPPARPRLARQATHILKILRKRHPKAEIVCSFHRGIWPDKFTTYKASAGYLLMASYAKFIGAKVVDVSNDLSKIKFYEEFDLHVGYRVHAHLHFLSKRIPSLLISEDGRGLGQSKTFQMPMLAIDDLDLEGKVENTLERFSQDNFNEFIRIGDFIDCSFETMKRFLGTI
jgi:flavodoxin